jgi:competence protein ComEC
MKSRESLWSQIAGPSGWAFAWALLLASALPWLVPETWDGAVPTHFFWAGWALAIGSFGLLRSKGFRAVALNIIVLWASMLGLSRLARWEVALPVGYQEIEGVICEPWQKRGFRQLGGVAVALPIEMKGLKVPISVPAKGEPPPIPGTPVRFRTDLRPALPGPSFLAERPLWRARSDGRPRQASLSSALLLETIGSPKPSPLLRFRGWMMDRFQALPIDSAPARDLWGALALGIFPLSDDVSSAFGESGTLHLLVVSGLQITLIMGTVEVLLRKIIKRGSGAGAIAAGLIFAALVGFSAPILRGLLMGIAWVFGRAQGWKIPPALSLHLALLLWLVLHPAAGCTPGFLLGWWAMLGLIWVSGSLEGLISPLLGNASAPIARVAAPWMTTLPLLALMNGWAPAWGILTNLFVLPFVWVLLPLCLALTILPIPAVVGPTVLVLEFLASRLVPFFAKAVPLATGLLWPWLALIIGWLLLAQFRSALQKSRMLTVGLIAGTAMMLATKGTGRSPTSLTLDAPDVGQGEAILLRLPGEDATLIDCGPTPWSARRLVRLISRRGTKEPIHLVITHPHSDHAGGWATFERLWPVASITIPAVAHPDSAWAAYSPTGSISKAMQVRRGDAWSRGNAHFSVRWPAKPFRLSDPNMLSAVLRVRWNAHELWLMGDTLAIQEKDMIDLGDPGPYGGRRLLKTGHHGGATATSQEWIDALMPRVVLFTAEHPNRFGFPAPMVVSRCEASGADVLATGPSKGLKMEASADGWIVQPYLR